MTHPAPESRIVLGQLGGAHGVKGWLRVNSYTQPPENILNYSPWYLDRDGEGGLWEPVEGQQRGSIVLVRLRGCDDREQAERLKGATIRVAREQLPAAGQGEYYWHDLIGLSVEDCAGRPLGRVVNLMETGANDVLVLADARGQGEILIPYIKEQVVRAIDLDAGRMVVDWDPDY